MPLLRPANNEGIYAKLVHETTGKHARSHQNGWGYAVHQVPYGVYQFGPNDVNKRALVHRFTAGFDGGYRKKNGLYVREADGSYTFQNWYFDEAIRKGYAEEDIFVIGRDGYYLTMEEARQAIPDGVIGVHYVDDFNDEFQDFFVCKADGIQPEPFEQAQQPEPIQ